MTETNNRVRYHYQTGLSNSGTTIVRDAIAQHPNIFVHPTSDYANMYRLRREYWSTSQEYGPLKVQEGEEEANRIVVQTFQNCIDSRFYRPGYDHILTKDWGWIDHHESLAWTHPDSMLLVHVRHPMVAMASILKRERRTAGLHNGAGSAAETFEDRMMRAFSLPDVKRKVRGGALGHPMAFIESILKRGQRKFENVHFLRYEDFCNDPGRELKAFYAKAGIEWWSGHDFENVEPLEKREVDHVYRGNVVHRGQPGPVRPAVSDWREFIPQDYARDIAQQFPLFFKEFNYAT